MLHQQLFGKLAAAAMVLLFCAADAFAGGQCQIVNCHGLQIECGRSGPVACTMMYQLGDRCRDFAKCVEIDGACRFTPTAEFEACTACVENCKVKHPSPEQMPELFSCESSCGSPRQ